MKRSFGKSFGIIFHWNCFEGPYFVLAFWDRSWLFHLLDEGSRRSALPPNDHWLMYTKLRYPGT